MSASTGEAAPLLQRLGDGLNPLVVKEVRQGLRTRVFWVCFTLMLVACLLLSLSAYVNARREGFTTYGKGYFLAYYMCLGLVHFFVIPYSAYRSLAREREEETWVLLVLTGLGPRRILRGKVLSFLVQAALYGSAVGPFLLFSYYLNGVALPSILLVLLLGGAWLAFLTVLGVCAATLADGRMGRAFVHFLVLGALAMALLQGFLVAFVLMDDGERWLRDKDFLASLVAGAWALLGHGWLLFEAAASRLSLPTENYTRGPRRALAIHLVLSSVLVWALWEMQGREADVATFAAMLGCLHLVAAGLFVVSDVDGQARALRAGTRPWSLLRPGALRGHRFMVLLFAAWTLFCVVLVRLSSDYSASRLKSSVIIAAAAYGVLFLSLALVVGRMPRSDRLASPVAVRGLFFVLVALSCVLPPLVAQLLGLKADDGLVNLFNPFVGMENFGSTEVGGENRMPTSLLGFVGVVSLLTALAADRVLVERERRAHAS